MAKIDDRSFMKIALEEALEAYGEGEVPVGAVLVKDGLIVRGHNMVIQSRDPTAHAEIVVIRDMSSRVGNYRLSGSSLYVTLEPCIMCVGAIVQARIARLVFGAPDKRFGAVESMLRGFELGLNHRPEVVSGIMEEEVRDLLRDFFSKRR
ncbi:MAG: tRNA-specific adenosine deaminase [Deltaproteobacteria bacterium]|nr:MAG: tRNA-specific adenosine deaminase [Deltaproteobacteria bacterium]